MKLLLSLFLCWLPILALAGLAELSALAAPGQVKVSWDIHNDTNCTGYLVLWGIHSQSYSATNVVSGRLNNTAVITNLPVGVTYIVAQATGETDAQTSIYSDELLWTNPPALTPPRNVTLKAVIQASVTSNGPWNDLAWVKTAGAATGQVFRAVLVTEVDK
jgi:hypothetical protein